MDTSSRLVRGVFGAIVFGALALSGCASTSSTATTNPGVGGPLGQIAALPGYQVSVFATGTSKYFGPDSLVDDSSHIFIDYQNTTAKDCSDAATASSTVVEYTLSGAVVKTFAIPGHSDGMREDPSSHLLWITSCEDGNPRLVTLDPASGTITPYTLSTTVHGGGYDDLAFVNGMAFIACSNPNLNSAGVNAYPAVDEVTLSNGAATVKPVLMGNASATDVVSKTTVTINANDPDSMTVDPQGNLVLIDQGGLELITISNPGTAQQAVSRLTVGDQLDDTVYATQAEGRLLVSDGVTNVTYWIRATFVKNTVNKYLYTEAPNDSGTVGFVGTIDPATGLVTPAVIGLQKPTGMLFVPDAK
jgi:hypothetical protein